MIDMCTAFSFGENKNRDKDTGKDKNFQSLFNIESSKRQDLKLALEALKEAAVGRQTSKDTRKLGVRDLRNKLFHDFLTISTQDFDNLVGCSKQLLASTHAVISCLCGEHSSDCVQQALNEIDAIDKRNLTVSKLSDDERDNLNRRNQEMLQELEKMKSRKFDSFAVCLKHDIQEHLIPSLYAVNTCSIQFFNPHIRQSKRQAWGAGNSLQSLLSGSDYSCQIIPRQQAGGQGTAAGVEFADVVDPHKHRAHVLHCV